ncbi:PDZ domain-containing protein [Opitutaceae bacterium]|nr:PDZ domain-containing protein [Opitutaceae bacterium]
MKTTTKFLSCLTAAIPLFASALIAGDEVEVEKKMRVIVASDKASSVHEWVPADKGDGHSIAFHMDEADLGPHTFLGVETTNVGSTLGKQLGLTRGVGLVVARVVPDTGAAKVLEKHDIIVKFEDQLLVSSNQLGVLVQTKEPGAEVELTIVREGKEQVVVATLGEKKAKTITIKHGSVVPGSHGTMSIPSGLGHSDLSRKDIEGLLGKLGGEGGSLFFSEDDEGGPVVRMMNINRGSVVFSDDEGTVKLIADEGPKRLIVIDGDSKTIFSGPVATAEEREKLSEEIKARLLKVESIESLQMSTDGDFEIEEDVHVTVPHASIHRVKPHVDLTP